MPSESPFEGFIINVTDFPCRHGHISTICLIISTAFSLSNLINNQNLWLVFIADSQIGYIQTYFLSKFEQKRLLSETPFMNY